jgi:hypothetical protein
MRRSARSESRLRATRVQRLRPRRFRERGQHLVLGGEDVLARDQPPLDEVDVPLLLPRSARYCLREMRNVVVTPVRYGGPRRSRNLEERVMVRFPGAWRALAALGLRLLSPRSRLRRVSLRRQVVSGWDAVSRRDFELMLVRYARDVEVETDPDSRSDGDKRSCATGRSALGRSSGRRCATSADALAPWTDGRYSVGPTG